MNEYFELSTFEVEKDYFSLSTYEEDIPVIVVDSPPSVIEIWPLRT